METVTEFLSKLSSSGVKLSVEAGQLNCYAQKGSLTSDLKADILKYKPELIALLESIGKKQAVPATHRSSQRPKEFPLSAGQKGLYILDKLHPGTSAYNVPVCLRINSIVNAELLAKAWSLVLEQFPILTARVIEKEGSLYHLLDVACRTTLQQRTIDVADDDQLLSFLRAQTKAPFDLNRGPLTRAGLFTLRDGSSVLLIGIHHILFDGVSGMILLRALLRFYEQLCGGTPVSLSPDLTGYHQFVAWEEALLASPQGAAHAKFWQKQLDGELPAIELPPDWRRPASASLEGRTLVEPLPEDLVHLIRELSRSHSALPSVIFLAVFQLLLHEYTNEDDIIVGMPVMGRAAQQFAGEVGYFINMVPLRAQCGERITLIDFLRKVQGTMLDALYHSSYPFPLMVDKRETRQWERNPVFQVTFAYQNYVRGDDFASLMRQQTLELGHMPGIYQEGDSDFGIDIFETEASSFSVHLQYNPGLYAYDTIKGVFERYCVLLRAVAENPGRLLNEYSVLTEPEKQKLLAGFNDTRAEYPADKCIHELFAEQAGVTPDNAAVIAGDEQLTYRQLLAKSQDLALYLQSMGVGPDDLVALCMERSPEMVVGLLGILQAGGAYVPLDPHYPVDRLAYMLRDSRASIVLTQETLRDKLAALMPDDTRLVALDRQWPEIADRVAALKAANVPLRHQVGPHHMAYVIYTSGSTGQPKGVMVPHRGLVNHATYFKSRLRLSPDDRVLQFATLSFDTAAEEIFPAWLAGACLVLRADGPPPAPAGFLGMVDAAGVTVLDLPTAYWHELADHVGDSGGRSVPSSIRAVILGGETASAERFEKWRRVAGDTLLLNTYGPTEATIIATAYEPGATDVSSVALPIGRPIANVQTYVLDEEQQPVPVGIAGELYIGGAGVARGYLNRPELTAERFITDPFRGEAGARLYMTGDRVRYRRDGVLEFLGRADDQVKIRGFRIEPGEIETALRQHPAVRDAVVQAREDKPGERRLVAYVVTHNGETLLAGELRTTLKASLPEFMIPAAFVPLEKIPTLPNGKLDRRALARIEVTVESSRAFLAPRNETERRLAAIWADVLTQAPERIGVHDNFFELGGHSLLATRVISKIRSEMDIELPLKALFERTSVAQLAELIATAKRRAIPPILPVDRAKFERLPLSFAQERLWFIDQLEPDSAGYNVPGAVILRGELDVEQLEHAFNLLIERHENLRTVFPSEDGRARQVILDRLDFKLDRIDLSQHATRDERDARARQLCQLDAASPFDLASGPLLRGKVIKLAADEYILMANMHHIVSDGWSMGVFVNEFGAILDALRQNRRPELPPLPIQYADYSVWQRTWLEEGGVLDEQLGYWQKKLAGVPESLDLATDYARPVVQSFAGATQKFALDAQLTAQLRRLAEQQGGTLYMVLLAAFKTLLHRYTGKDDICVGSPIANRQYGETEGLIGMFVNTLALRTEVNGDDTFAALVANVKATCLEAYEYQDAPFEKVVDTVRPQRNMAISPLFQVMFILQNTAAEALDPSIEAYPLENGISKFDLTVEFTETADGLAGAIEYSTALYKPQTIARMVGHLTALCRAITAKPSARVCDLDYLGEEETRRLLVGYNATRADYPAGHCLHDLFAEEAARHPENTAVVCGEERLTYRQLLEKSRDLALYLQWQGVAPDNLVGVCMDRSLDMVVSLLGILEAGGAYVPLDPAYPEERLAYMLRDGHPAIVLTQETIEEKLRAVIPPDTQLVAVDRQRAELEERVAGLKARGVALRRQVAPHHLAYVIYTSGSTGQPKGVAIEHHSPVTLVHWAREIYSGEELAGMLASTSICFDLSVYEIFVTLAGGGTVILVPDALALADDPNRESVTIINTVPSAMEELVRLGAIPQSVRTINLAGEPLPARLVDKIYDTTAAGKVYDLYGPSEDTTYSTYVLRTKNGPQTIGRPIANTQVYILDGHARLQPIGVPGELYIAGEGLAREYLNRPELTAEKFVANPFTPGTRMYRTGDLARWLDDGTIQYLGRIDTQVKVRGFRIEMGEIETWLGQDPRVQDCAVIAQGEGANKQLVAFYRAAGTTADHLAELPNEELRALLLQTLPEYMVPAAFVSLAAIPLTPNGKVDRRALLRIDVTMTSGQAYIAPRNETERQLVAIWAEVLNVAPVKIGVNDNFFELGGHSLLATQLISKVRSELGMDVPLRAVFERASVAQFADLIATAKQNEIPPIVPVDRAQFEQLPLSFAQERLWFIDQLEPESAGYNIPGAIRYEGELDVDQLEAAFNLIIARHETLRTIFPSEDGRAQQVILDGVHFALERVDLRGDPTLEARERAAKELCRIEATTPFDLARGPLLRGKAIRLAEDDHILMLNMHHIISDGWSIGVLFRELGLVMNALREGRRPELAPLPIQYADYSVWQRTRLEEGGVLDEQLGYWQKKLAGVPESLDLATDYARPGVQSFAGSTQAFALDTQLTSQLRRLAEQQGGTLYMVLLAAVKALLYRYTGQNDICVGSPIANRQYGETEGLIGMFVNTLVLRSQIESEESFATLLSKVKATCLEAYEHQDAPFEKVVDVVRPQRNMAMTPLFQVMVILQNAAAEAPDPAIEVYPLEAGISKFDLTVEFSETADGLAGAIEYSTVLYKPQTIARMVTHFTALCEAIAARPTARICDLDYLGAAELHRLLADYNATDAEYPKDRCVHQLFVEQAALHADDIAVTCEGEHLTYRELYARSRDLAFYLQSEGVGPDRLIGLCMDRSLDMLVGLMGILQAGGAYVPLDPEYPDERLEYMLRDSEAAIVLTQETLRDKLTALVTEGTRLVALDRQWPEIETRVAELKVQGVPFRQDVRPHHLAYVIYTSGSTGKPKGVEVTHGSAVNLLCSMGREPGMTRQDTLLAVTTLSFDIAGLELYLPLCVGARLVVATRETASDGMRLLATLRSCGATIMQATPVTWRMLLEAGWKGDPKLTALCGGEALPRELANQLLETGSRLWNVYGPTETTIWSTAWLVEPGTGQVPLGFPIANTQIYVLDQHGHPQPLGVPGELHIAGDGLARGYRNRPELTQEKFVANPFRPGSRMYRTGDRARWLDDGTLQYLGRIDTQVKVRGFRIETGEIEARLNQHDAIRDSVVVPQGQDANKQLIAFYQSEGTTTDHVADLPYQELRAHLLRTLPEYMVPAAFVSVAAFPLTPNGKVDRRALERMDVTMASGQAYVAPRNDTESRLVAIWAEVLDLSAEKIGVNDNFFELGGHSMRAMHLMAKVAKQYTQRLPLATLFAAPTIAALARLLSGEEGIPSFDILVPIQPNGQGSPVFAVPGLGGNVVSLLPLSRAFGANQPFYGLQAIGVDGKTPPPNSVGEIAQANIAALKSRQPEGPYRLVGHSYGGVVAYEMARMLLEQGDDISSLILLDSFTPAVMQESFFHDDGAEFFEAFIGLAGLYDVDLGEDFEAFRQASNEADMDRFIGLLNDRGVELDGEQLAVVRSVYEANVRCYRAYEPPMLPRPIDASLYKAGQVDRDRQSVPPDHGWNQLLPAPIRIHHVEADHYSIVGNVRF